MFELVVGELDLILGEVEEKKTFEHVCPGYLVKQKK
jgi:hypothetical protein